MYDGIGIIWIKIAILINIFIFIVLLPELQFVEDSWQDQCVCTKVWKEK